MSSSLSLKRARSKEVHELNLEFEDEEKITAIHACEELWVATDRSIYVLLHPSACMTFVSGKHMTGAMKDGNSNFAVFQSIKALIKAGNFLIVIDDRRVRLVSFDGGVETLVMDQPSGESLLEGPNSIVQADEDTFYISDCYSHKIFKLTKTLEEGMLDWKLDPFCGGAATYIDGPLGEARFCMPTGLAMSDESNYLFVCDSGNNVIRQIDLLRREVSTLVGSKEAGYVNGSTATAKLTAPAAIITMGALLFVSEPSLRTIRVFDTRVNVMSPFVDGNNSFYPSVLTSDPKGIMYVLNSCINDVMSIESEGVSVEKRLRKPDPPPDPRIRVTTDMTTLLEMELFCDIVLKVFDQNFNVHKVVLAARSEFFTSLFKYEKNDVIALEFQHKGLLQDRKTTLFAFDLLIKYFYSGILPSYENMDGHGQLECLFLLSDMYRDEFLVQHCISVYENEALACETITQNLIFVYDFHIQILEKKALNFLKIKSNALVFSVSVNFQSESHHMQELFY